MSKHKGTNVGNIADKLIWDQEILKLWRRRYLLTNEQEEIILNITKNIPSDVR